MFKWTHLLFCMLFGITGSFLAQGAEDEFGRISSVRSSLIKFNFQRSVASKELKLRILDELHDKDILPSISGSFLSYYQKEQRVFSGQPIAISKVLELTKRDLNLIIELSRSEPMILLAFNDDQAEPMYFILVRFPDASGLDQKNIDQKNSINKIKKPSNVVAVAGLRG